MFGSSRINTKLVYDAIPLVDNVLEASREVQKAKEKHEKAIKAYEEGVAKLLGKQRDELRFTRDNCFARGIHFHCFPKDNPEGFGRNRCVFCETDDCMDF